MGSRRPTLWFSVVLVGFFCVFPDSGFGQQYQRIGRGGFVFAPSRPARLFCNASLGTRAFKESPRQTPDSYTADFGRDPLDLLFVMRRCVRVYRSAATGGFVRATRAGSSGSRRAGTLVRLGIPFPSRGQTG